MKTEAPVLRVRTRTRLLAGFAAFIGLSSMGALPAAAAQAAPDDAWKIDSYVVSSTYSGYAVDIRVYETDLVAELDQVRIVVHRAVGGDVVKVDKPTGSVVATLKAGQAVTAPIVIQQGSYDELGSSSWVKPDATWAAETVPTGTTVELVDGDGDILLSRTIGLPATRNGVALADVMPAAPAFTSPAANFRDGADYAGIAVDVRVRDVTDATRVVVRVDREGAPAVVKTSKPALLSALNMGGPRSLTVPIVIRAGSYDESASSSWNHPGAVWTPTSVPTSVTVTIERAHGAALVATLPIGGSIGAIMPTASEPVVIPLPAEGPFEVNVPDGAGDVSLDLGTPVGGTIAVPVEVTVTTPAGVELVIPAGATVTSDDPSWDGVISLPVVKTGVTVPSTGTQKATVALAIEVGSATSRLEFDGPVKLVLPGQAGKKAGFIQGGVFTAITATCASATPATVDDACAIDDGADLVIWTSHFTTFVSYSLAATGGATEIAATGVGDITPALLAAGALLLIGGGLVVAGRGRRVAAARPRH